MGAQGKPVPVRGGTDTLIARLARRQDSLVTRAQLQRIGLTPRQIDRRLNVGRLEVVHRGVYLIGGATATYQQAVRAAVLAGGPRAVASHRSAAVLWGVGRLGHDRWLEDEPVDITVPYEDHPALAGVIVHRSLDLTDPQVSSVSGVRTTSPLRLCVDLGAVCPWWAVETVFERLVERRLVHPRGVRLAYAALSKRGRRGCGAIRRVLENRALGDAVTDARSESVFANLCRGHGLPLPRFQVPLVVFGRRCRIDFAYPELRLAIEIDGYEFHGDREAFRSDRARDVDLTAMGWQVVRFTWDDLVFEPARTAARLRAILTQRRRLLAA